MLDQVPSHRKRRRAGGGVTKTRRSGNLPDLRVEWECVQQAHGLQWTVGTEG